MFPYCLHSRISQLTNDKWEPKLPFDGVNRGQTEWQKREKEEDEGDSEVAEDSDGGQVRLG